MTGFREKESTGFRRMNRRSRDEGIGVHPPFQIESNHVVDRNVVINWMNMRSPDRQ